MRTLSGLLFPQPEAFALDFHALPYRGDAAALARHYLPRRGKAGTSVRTFFALENARRVLGYANANRTRADQAGEPLRCVEFGQERTGADPQWLSLDSTGMTDPDLSVLNRRGVCCVTIRRRGVALVRRLSQLPSSAWPKAVSDPPTRCPQHLRYVDERVRRPGYAGAIRQLAGTGLGREKPTLFLGNHVEETARAVSVRYAGRNRMEDGLGPAVNFVHLDCLARAVRWHVAVDAALTVLANGC